MTKEKYTLQEIETRSCYDQLDTNYFLSDLGFVYERRDDFELHYLVLLGNVNFDVKDVYLYDSSEFYYPIKPKDYSFIKRSVEEQHENYYGDRNVSSGLTMDEIDMNEDAYYYDCSYGFIFQVNNKKIKMVANVNFDINEYSENAVWWFDLDALSFRLKKISFLKED